MGYGQRLNGFTGMPGVAYGSPAERSLARRPDVVAFLLGLGALVIAVAFSAAFARSASPISAGADSADASRAYAKLPPSFVPNKGQTHSSVRYYAQGPGYGFYFTKDKVVLSFTKGKRGVALQLAPVGANPHSRLEAGGRQPGRVNHLHGSEHYANLPTYRELTYRELWPGIDLVFRGQGGKLKYELVLRPGANPNDVRLAYRGADGLSIGAAGSLLIDTPLGTLRDSRPRSYQEVDGRRVGIESSYALERGGGIRYGFELGTYDAARPLVIDPGLVYSTYLGGAGPGSGVDQGNAIAVDAAGSAYVTGSTNAADFPTTPGAFDTTLGSPPDAFVTKLNAAGTGVVYSTYLGGTGLDDGNGIAVDAAGSAYVTGETRAADFPTTPGAPDTAREGFGAEAFVTKLNAAGSALVYSTYLGGAAIDFARAIAVDTGGSAYVTGLTDSANFPTTAGAFDTTKAGIAGANDAFATKLNAAGTGLAYSTYLGGTLSDDALGIAVDAAGSAYVTGFTNTDDFPTTAGAFDTTRNAQDAFATKLNAAGSNLVYSTFLGGSSNDQGHGIAVDAAGSAYVTGDATSANFPTTPGAFDSTSTSAGAFVTKFNATGSGLVYSTRLGGDRIDRGRGIAVDAAGSAYVTGITTSTDFPTTAGAFDTTYASAGGFPSDVFVTKFNAAGSGLVYSTYLGGVQVDEGHGIAVDAGEGAYVTGFTNFGVTGGAGFDFPTTAGAFDTSPGGIQEAFVSKFDLAEPPSGADLAVTKSDSPDPVTVGQPLNYTLTVTNNGPDPATGVTLTDTLPAGVTFVSATGGCTEAAGVVTCTIGALGSGGTATREITVTPQSAGTITNEASVSGGETDLNTANNSDSEATTVVSTPPPQTDLSVTKADAPDPVTVGGTLTYTLTVRNGGPAGATGVTLTDLLPAGVTFQSASTGCTESSGVVTCVIGSLANGATATIEITVTPESAGTITNEASVSGSESDPTLANNTATQDTTVEDVPPPTPELSINNVSVTEGDSGTTNATFTVSLSSAAALDVTVDFSTAADTATAPGDFTARTGALTIPAGQTSGTITVAVVGDTLVEGNETFQVNLSNASANATIADAQGVGTIIDDDEAPTPELSINDVSVTEGDSGTTDATFTVSLSSAATGTVTVGFATAPNTATAPADYTSASGTLTFAPGVTSQTVTVAVVGDTLVEGNETFFVNLTGASPNASIADPQGVGTIVDDDESPAPAALLLSPASATNTVGTEHCVTATVRDGAGNPVSGITVRFSASGANSASGSDTTVANGEASLCYTGANAGDDTIRAFADTNGDGTQGTGEPGGEATKRWTAQPPTEPDCEIEGRGWVKLDGGWARFKIDVESDMNPHGKLRLKVHKGLRLKSTEIGEVLVSTNASAAAVLGTVRIKGGGSVDFRVDVEDLPGAPDTFRIQLSNGYDSGEQRIRGDLDIECENDDPREDEDDKDKGDRDEDGEEKGGKGNNGNGHKAGKKK